MKIRTCLILACMVVVPLIAMFSHRLPVGTRDAIRAVFGSVVAVARPSAAAPPTVVPQSPEPVVPAATADEVPVAPAAEVSPTKELPQAVPVAGVEVESLARLRDLGALGVDCRPLAGGRGHVARCRLPIDAAGQLERVFQALGPDAESAAARLLRDVTAWKHVTTAERRTVIRF